MGKVPMRIDRHIRPDRNPEEALSAHRPTNSRGRAWTPPFSRMRHDSCSAHAEPRRRDEQDPGSPCDRKLCQCQWWFHLRTCRVGVCFEPTDVACQDEYRRRAYGLRWPPNPDNAQEDRHRHLLHPCCCRDRTKDRREWEICHLFFCWQRWMSSILASTRRNTHENCFSIDSRPDSGSATARIRQPTS